MTRPAARRTDEECWCGRPIVIIAKGKLLVCQGCASDAPFCTCHRIGLHGLEAMLDDMQRR